MDFQAFVNQVEMPCCVISVEKKADGGCGDITILCANQPYKRVMGPGYYDHMPYDQLVPKDNKFEEFCFRAAVLKEKMHAYVETKALNCWTDQTLIPLASDREDRGYCQFIFEFTKNGEPERMADVSAGIAAKVIQASIMLISQEHFKENVENVLGDLLSAAEASASRIILVDHDRLEANILCEKQVDSLWPAYYQASDQLTYDLVCSWEDIIGVSNCIIIKNTQDMALVERQNPAWAANLRQNGISSIVLVPLRGGKSVIGYLYVVNFNVDKVVEVKELLELMAFFLGGEIYNHMLVKRLEEISSLDELTGLQNRRAMLKRMRRIEAQEERTPFGVINIDLNGLKAVNDLEGHEAGDRMLRQAGELLIKVFRHEELYRTGGDEFVLISEGVASNVFDSKVQRLRSDVAKSKTVSFAIGAFWSDGRIGMKEAMKMADEFMYADKRAFYEKNPALKRK